MSHKDKKGKQSTRNPEDEVQDKSSHIIKRHPSRLLGAGNRPPATPDAERVRPNTRPTSGTQETQESAGRGVATPTNRPVCSKTPATPDAERVRGRNISSSSLSSRLRIDNIKELQARKPNIRLPSNLFNIFEKTDVAPPAEDLPTGLFFGRIMNERCQSSY